MPHVETYEAVDIDPGALEQLKYIHFTSEYKVMYSINNKKLYSHSYKLHPEMLFILKTNRKTSNLFYNTGENNYLIVIP